MDLSFINPTKGELPAGLVIADIADFISLKPDKDYQIVIGTDSQTKSIDGNPRTDFVTVIVVYGEGAGGRYYYKKISEPRIMALRQKIHQETWLSIEVAQALVPEIRSAVSAAKYTFQIHIDVGSLGPTREMISEVVGMVSANGYHAEVKPNSWAASSIADKHAH